MLADLDRRGRPRSRRWCAGLDEAGWRTPTPAAGLGRRDQIAHLAWTDEVAVAAATDKAAWDAVVLEAHRRPDGLRRRRGARRRRRPTRPRSSPGGGAARAALDEVLRDYPAGREDAVVRPADEPDLDGDRPLHGDLGARARRAEALGIEPEPTDRIRHVAHLGVRTRNFAFGVHALEPPAEEFRVELRRALGRAVGVGAGRRGAVGHRLGVRLLPAGDPAPPPRRPRPGRRRADADRWLDIAQAFAGPPGPDGRRRWLSRVERAT